MLYFDVIMSNIICWDK